MGESLSAGEWARLAEQAFLEERHQDACAASDNALEVDPDCAPALFEKARALVVLRRLREGELYVREYLATPDADEDMREKAEALLGAVEQILEPSRQADPIQEDFEGLPEEVLSRTEEAEEDLEGENPERGLETYRTLLLQRPTSPALRLNLAYWLLESDSAPEAHSILSRLTVEFPRSRRAWHNLGKCLSRQDRTQEAIDAFLKALEMEISCPGVWCDIGRMWLAVLRLPEAATCFDHARRLDPEFVVALVQAGRCHGALGRRSTALRCYEAALELDPSCSEAREGKRDLERGR